MFESLGLVSRLKGLLTDENTGYLDVMLRILTDPRSKTYQQFWVEFNERLGFAAGTLKSSQATAAWNALRNLHGIVLDYSKGD